MVTSTQWFGAAVLGVDITIHFMKLLLRAIALWLFYPAIFVLSTTAEQTSGIGVALGKEGPRLVVKAVLPDSPAAQAGAIKIGDRIIEIAEGNMPAVDAREMQLEEAVGRIRGPKGTSVRLTIVPMGVDESHARVTTISRGELDVLSRWGDGDLLASGERAPNISWVRLESRQQEHLADFSGKVIVLEFWATWCGPCQPIVAELQTYPEKYHGWESKVILITASVDENPDLAEVHVEQRGWTKTHQVWVGPNAVKAFHVNALPTTYIIDQSGEIVSAGHMLDVPAIVSRLIDSNNEKQAASISGQ